MTQTIPAAVDPIDVPVARRRRPGASKALLGLTAPAIIWYTIFTIGPMIAVFYIAMLDWPAIISPSTFIGLGNFQRVFADPVFYTACINSLIQIAIVIPVMIPLAFMVGYYVNLRPRGHRLLRVILFTPALISIAAKSVIFLSIFSPNGLLNNVLGAVGLGFLETPWTASPSTALGVVIAVDLWNGIGFTAILFSARLSSVSHETFEAAELDGAGHWRRMWSVAYPVIRDYFGVLAMLQFLWVMFGSAASILLLTRGGPGTSSTNLSFLVYDKAFSQSQVGYSQAVGVILVAVGVVGIVGIRRIFRARY